MASFIGAPRDLDPLYGTAIDKKFCQSQCWYVFNP